jgi:hypothetical protein
MWQRYECDVIVDHECMYMILQMPMMWKWQVAGSSLCKSGKNLTLLCFSYITETHCQIFADCYKELLYDQKLMEL